MSANYCHLCQNKGVWLQIERKLIDVCQVRWRNTIQYHAIAGYRRLCGVSEVNLEITATLMSIFWHFIDYLVRQKKKRTLHAL